MEEPPPSDRCDALMTALQRLLLLPPADEENERDQIEEIIASAREDKASTYGLVLNVIESGILQFHVCVRQCKQCQEVYS